MGASVRNSARQVGHQVAKYIMNAGLPVKVRSANAITVPSDLSMVKAGGISPTFVPTGAAGTVGASVATAVGVSAGGAGVCVAAAVAVGVDVAVTAGVSPGAAAAVGEEVVSVVAAGARVAGCEAAAGASVAVVTGASCVAVVVVAVGANVSGGLMVTGEAGCAGADAGADGASEAHAIRAASIPPMNTTANVLRILLII